MEGQAREASRGRVQALSNQAPGLVGPWVAYPTLAGPTQNLPGGLFGYSILAWARDDTLRCKYPRLNLLLLFRRFPGSLSHRDPLCLKFFSQSCPPSSPLFLDWADWAATQSGWVGLYCFDLLLWWLFASFP